MHSIIWVFTREQPSSINSALSEEAVSHVRRKYFSLKLLKRRFVDKSYNLKLTSAYTKWIHCQNYYHLHKTIKHQMASSSSILCFILEHLNHVTVYNKICGQFIFSNQILSSADFWRICSTVGITNKHQQALLLKEGEQKHITLGFLMCYSYILQRS